MAFLIRKRAHPAVREQRPVTEQRELRGVVRRQRHAGNDAAAQLILYGVALIAHGQRGVLAEREERRCRQSDIRAAASARRRALLQLHMSSAGTMTRLAVDGE